MRDQWLERQGFWWLRSHPDPDDMEKVYTVITRPNERGVWVANGDFGWIEHATVYRNGSATW